MSYIKWLHVKNQCSFCLHFSLICIKFELLYFLRQWRSQGGGQSGQTPPVGLDSYKNIVGSVVHAAELN